MAKSGVSFFKSVNHCVDVAHAHGVRPGISRYCGIGNRSKRGRPGVKFWSAGIYFLVLAIFVASKLWIWCLFNHFCEGFFNFVKRQKSSCF